MSRFIGRCDELTAEDLHAFDETCVDIDNAEFLRVMGQDAYNEFEKSLGYDASLRLVADWHVSYVAGVWKGQPAVCCFWSEYHHIFLASSEMKQFRVEGVGVVGEVNLQGFAPLRGGKQIAELEVNESTTGTIDKGRELTPQGGDRLRVTRIS